MMDKVAYTNCYCEENVYNLAKYLRDKEPDSDSYACFISNEKKQAPVFYQKLSQDDFPCIWDYHVILISKGKNDEEFIVQDFDTKLNKPENFKTYLSKALKEIPGYEKVYRVVNSEDFLNYFSSDRSHMLKDGKYLSDPPKYPSIKSSKAETDNTFPRYINCTDDSDKRYGNLFDYTGLLKKFS